MKTRLRIIRPSSREQGDGLAAKISALRAAGFTVLFDETVPDAHWTYTSASASTRAKALEDALSENGTDAVLCARGGYGASDLLPLLDWDRLRSVRPKLVVGFSDVSALHAGLEAKLGWPSVHAPMPATTLWQQDGLDVMKLLSLIEQWTQGGVCEQAFEVTPVRPGGGPVAGVLFGGCFTVLTNLIATPYFPKSLRGRIVFLEDTDENPARLMRAFNQWQQAGLLEGVQGLVLGHLRNLGEKIPDCATYVYEEFARRCSVPVYTTPLFGHTRPNMPLMVGASAQIDGSTLTWRQAQPTFPPRGY